MAQKAFKEQLEQQAKTAAAQGEQPTEIKQ